MPNRIRMIAGSLRIKAGSWATLVGGDHGVDGAPRARAHAAFAPIKQKAA